MECHLSGEIRLSRNLTKQEFNELKHRFEFVSSQKDGHLYLCEFINAFLEDAQELAEYLDYELGVNIVDKSIIEYYGDYDGALRFENGKWVDYDKECALFEDTNVLIHILEERGFTVTKRKCDDDG